MATVVNFHGKNYIEPGAYAVTEYNPTSVANVAQFGNVMIIDTGLSMNGSYEFSGGAGINGELSKGLKSVYEFDTYDDFYSFIGGGKVADIADKLFTPYAGAAGAPKVYYVRAATTTSATLTVGDVTLKCKNEGIVGNGVISDGILKVGYGVKVIAGTEDSSKFKVQLFRGNFQGVDNAGEAFGAYSFADAKANLLAESPEMSTCVEFYNWATANKYVRNHFEVSIAASSSAVLALKSLTAATGGTTTYLSNNEYSDVLEAITELDVTFFLCTNTTAADGIDANTNGRLFTFIKQNQKLGSVMFVPGGSDDTDLFGDSNTSEAIAKYYNSDVVAVVHGAPVVSRKDRNGNKQLESIYLTAAIVGLNAGMAAQTPLTFKRVGYQSFAYDLRQKEREKALQAGIMHVRNVSGYWCVNQGVTTLQHNERMLANDGQTSEMSVSLVKIQLNKELVLDAEQRFCGSNAGSSNPQSVKNFVETKLDSLTARADSDNLIVEWKNVKVRANDTNYFVTYDFVPNVPINKIFFTGNILDFEVTA